MTEFTGHVARNLLVSARPRRDAILFDRSMSHGISKRLGVLLAAFAALGAFAAVALLVTTGCGSAARLSSAERGTTTDPAATIESHAAATRAPNDATAVSLSSATAPTNGTADELSAAVASTTPRAPTDRPMGAAEALFGRPDSVMRLAEGERVYREYCVGCHGERGDGEGPAARFLDPKPRDFTKAIFKFASVPSGNLPRDEDLMRTLVHGLPGSSMPSWQFLPESERRALIAYIKTFSSGWKERVPGAAVAVSDNPYSTGDPKEVRRAIERGRVVYHLTATCWQCHAAYATQDEVNEMAKAEGAAVTLREGSDRPAMKPDAWDRPLLPTDFPRQRLKGGSSLQDLYRTVAAGVGGTAMPTWKEGLQENDLWALVYYVKSLADRRWSRPNAVPSPPPESLVPLSATGE